MGLILAKEQPSGATAEYHKVSVTNIDWHVESAEIHVISFKDKAARDAGKAPMTGMVHRFAGDNFAGFDHITNNTVVAYNKVKALDEWDGAVDDI